jgi:hypothetical protein
MFTEEQINGLEWQQIVPQQTKDNKYRVEITWALDRYRVSVRRIAGDVLIRSKAAFYRRTAVATANKFLHQFGGQ